MIAIERLRHLNAIVTLAAESALDKAKRDLEEANAEWENWA